MVATITNKDLALTFAPAIISLLFTAVIYISYTQNPECPQSEGASQCWDFRPLLIRIHCYNGNTNSCFIIQI